MRTTYRIATVPSGGIENQVACVPVKATSLLKTILLVAGLALVTATPSLAQSYDPSIGTGNIVPYYRQAPALETAQNAYARIIPRASRGARNAYARSVPGAAAFQRGTSRTKKATASVRIPIPTSGSSCIGNRCREG